MALDKLLLTFTTLLILFAACGVLHVALPFYTRMALSKPQTLSNVASTILLDQTPLDVAFVNGGLILLSALIAVPAIFLKRPRFRFLLTTHAYGVVASALLTLAIGLNIWFSTLKTKTNLGPIFSSQDSFIQSMLQFKFQCCGYNDPTVFVHDTTCTSAAVAAQLGGCMAPFSTYANSFLDIVFTTFFGFAAVDAMLLLTVFCVMKDRTERERYRRIDAKRPFSRPR